MQDTVRVTLSEALRHAYAAYKAGKFDVAERLCLQVIDANGSLFSAHHLLGIVQSARGEKLLALASFDRAIALRPDYVEALTNRGNTLHELERFDEALTNYERALAVRPDSVVVLYNRGNTLHALGRFDEALASHDRALALQPNHPQALSNRGATLCMLKRFEEALESYDRALAVRPNHAELLANRANTLSEIRRFDEAVAGYDRALALRPDHAEALSNRGTALRALKRFAESLDSHDRALALRPESVVTLSNRGLTLHDLGRFDEALESYDRALSLQPDDYAALINRGNTLRHLKRIDEALASYDRALSLQPGEFAALINRGNTLQQVKRIDEALVNYGQAINARPDNGEARFNAALCRLLLGDFERGFADYESRWHSPARAKDRRDFPQTLWLGAEEIAGKTILLHAEQGLGDTIQFSRYVPLVAARAGRVIVEAPASLIGLMRTLPAAFDIVAKGDELPVFDLHSPLLSLPLALGTRLETIPSAIPYLQAPPSSVTEWKAQLGSKYRPRIGLAWSGSPNHKAIVRDPFRLICSYRC